MAIVTCKECHGEGTVDDFVCVDRGCDCGGCYKAEECEECDGEGEISDE